MASARFHLPGLRYNYPLNMFWVSLKKKYPDYFREGVEIASFFGAFPVSLWNGGRFSNRDQCDEKFVRMVIKSINGQGIPIRFTYTNSLLTEEDLRDPFCNLCMEIADNGMNEVIVVSELLEDYIRTKYPSFKINSSTCKEIRSIEDVNAELEKDYRTVVLDYNLNNRWELIDRINDFGRVEVLVNSLCQPGCPRRGEHYRNISKNGHIVLENRNRPADKQIPVIPWKCEYGDHNCLYTIQDYPTFVSPDLIWNEYLPRGIRNFKIEGRTANLFSLIETYTFFMIKPEHAGMVRILLLNNLEQAGVLKINGPRPSL